MITVKQNWKNAGLISSEKGLWFRRLPSGGWSVAQQLKTRADRWRNGWRILMSRKFSNLTTTARNGQCKHAKTKQMWLKGKFMIQRSSLMCLWKGVSAKKRPHILSRSDRKSGCHAGIYILPGHREIQNVNLIQISLLSGCSLKRLQGFIRFLKII